MHLMADIETMATNSNAPVIEVGFIMFDHCNYYDEFSRDVKPDFKLSTPDVGTIAFWNRQETKMPLNENAEFFPSVLKDLVGWLGKTKIEGVWANDPAFDLVILHNLAESYGLKLPWDHRSHRCCRTMFDYAKRLGMKRYKSEILHSAVDDARAQARTIIDVNSYLAKRGKGFL